MDKNTVSLSGTVISRPVLSKVSERTQQAEFFLLVREWFLNKDGKDDSRKSEFKIEVLGKNSDNIARSVDKGQRVCVEGYLRQQPSGIVVRAFTVFDDNHYLLCAKEAFQEVLDRIEIDPALTMEQLKTLLKERIKEPVLKK